MQNLIPGVSWGKKMDPKQFDKMYQRMIQREKKKNQEIQNEVERKKDDDLIGCTFKPKTNHDKSKGKKQTGVSMPRMNSQDLDDMEDSYGFTTNRSVNKGVKASGKGKREEKFLARLEEMKRRDHERKERTRKKYEEKKKKDFENVCTFQPNKLRSKKSVSKSRSRAPSHNEPQAEKESAEDNHVRQVSGNVVGLNELLGQASDRKEKKSPIKKKVKKSHKGNAFLERIEQYKQKKFEKEKEREQLKKQQEAEELKKTCTFQPNKTSKKSKPLSQIKRSRMSTQNIPLTKSQKGHRISVQARTTNKVFSQIVKKYRSKNQGSEVGSLFHSKESFSIDKTKSRSRTTKNPSSNLGNKSNQIKINSGAGFEYQFDKGKEEGKQVKSVRSHIPMAQKKTSELEEKQLANPLNDTKSLNLNQEIKTENQNSKGKSQATKKNSSSNLQESDVQTDLEASEAAKNPPLKEGAALKESPSKIISNYMNLLTKPSLLNDPSELISNLPNQSSQATEVNVDAIVANTTANILKMLKENPAVAKEILGIEVPSTPAKRKVKRKAKTHRHEPFSFNPKRSVYKSKFKKSTITDQMKESYLSRKNGDSKNLSHRKSTNGITSRIKQNINQRYKNNTGKKLSHLRKKNLTREETFKKGHKGKISSRKSARVKPSREALELVTLGNQEVIDLEHEEMGQELVEIFNSQLVGNLQGSQTLNPSKIRKLKKVVQKIENENGLTKDSGEQGLDFSTYDKGVENKMTKTLDLGRPSNTNVYLRIDRLLNPKTGKKTTGRSTTPNKTKNFLKRNKEFLRKKNEKIQNKLKQKHASKSQTISKSRKKSILKSPIPSNTQSRCQKGKDMRKKQREIIASNLKPKYRGGVRWDPKGPKLPEKIKINKNKDLGDVYRCKSNNKLARSQVQPGEGHPSLKFILKPFSNRGSLFKKSLVFAAGNEDFGELEEERIEPKDWTVTRTDKDDEVPRATPVKLLKESKNNKWESNSKLKDSSESKAKSHESKNKETTEKSDSNLIPKRKSLEASSTFESKEIEKSLVLGESNVSQMPPVFTVVNDSEIVLTKKDSTASTKKKESKKKKNFSKENTVIKKEFKRKKSPFNNQPVSEQASKLSDLIPTQMSEQEPIAPTKSSSKKQKLKKKKAKKSKKSILQNYMQDLELQSIKKIENFEVSVRSRKSRKKMPSMSSAFNGKLFKTCDTGNLDFNRVMSIDDSTIRNSSTDMKTVQSFNGLSNRERIKLLLMSGEKLLFEGKAKSEEKKTKKKKKKAPKKKSMKATKAKSREEIVKKTKAKLKKKKTKKTKFKTGKGKSSNEIDLNNERFGFIPKENQMFKGEEEPRLCLPGPVKLENSKVSKKVNKWSKKKKSTKPAQPQHVTPIKKIQQSPVMMWQSNTPTLDLSNASSHLNDIPLEQSKEPVENSFAKKLNPFYNTTEGKENSNFNSVEQINMETFGGANITTEDSKLPIDSTLTFEGNNDQNMIESELMIADSSLEMSLPVSGLNFKKDKKPTEEIEISDSQIEIASSDIEVKNKDFIEQNEPAENIGELSTLMPQSVLESHFDFATNDLEEEKLKMNLENGVEFSQFDEKVVLQNLTKKQPSI